MAYWREQLSDVPAVLALPASPVRPDAVGDDGARIPVRLSGLLTGTIKALARRNGLTPFVVLSRFSRSFWHGSPVTAISSSAHRWPIAKCRRSGGSLERHPCFAYAVGVNLPPMSREKPFRNDLDRVRAVRERLTIAGTVVAHADGDSRDLFPVAIGQEEGRALRDWVHNESALRTLETGLGFAISTLFIIEGLLANGRSGSMSPPTPTSASGCRCTRRRTSASGFRYWKRPVSATRRVLPRGVADRTPAPTHRGQGVRPRLRRWEPQVRRRVP